MLCTQTFRFAKKQLAEALNDKMWTAATEQTNLPLPKDRKAIIVDVDETVLENAPAEARQVIMGTPLEMGGFNPDDFSAWVKEGECKPLPGAKKFIEFVRSKGVKVFYVTNREDKRPTLKNIRDYLDEQVSDDEVVVTDKVQGYEKSPRRAKIAQKYRILLLLGDDYNDFVSMGEKFPPLERRRLAEDYEDYWGERWFILPNPLYGSFEKSAKKHAGTNRSKLEVLKIQSIARQRKLSLSRAKLLKKRDKRRKYLNNKATHLRPFLLPGE